MRFFIFLTQLLTYLDTSSNHRFSVQLHASGTNIDGCLGGECGHYNKKYREIFSISSVQYNYQYEVNFGIFFSQYYLRKGRKQQSKCGTWWELVKSDKLMRKRGEPRDPFFNRELWNYTGTREELGKGAPRILSSPAWQSCRSQTIFHRTS